MSVDGRRLARWLGATLSVACIGYVVWQFVHATGIGPLLHAAGTGSLVAHLVLAAALYTGALALLAGTWWWLLGAWHASAGPALPVASAYAVSQFAKYLPGNVGQYVARHAFLRRMQVPHRTLVVAAATEAASLMLAALCWAVPAAGTFLAARLGVSSRLPVVVLAAALAIGAVALFVVPRLSWWRRWLPSVRAPRLVGVLAAHVVFFGLMILSLRLVAAGLPPSPGVWTLAGVASVGWLAGFVVVGSPGGLGVREAVFVELLQHSAGRDTALLLAAAFRLVTFAGDLAALLLGLAWFGWQRRHGAVLGEGTPVPR